MKVSINIISEEFAIYFNVIISYCPDRRKPKFDMTMYKRTKLKL